MTQEKKGIEERKSKEKRKLITIQANEESQMHRLKEGELGGETEGRKGSEEGK